MRLWLVLEKLPWMALSCVVSLLTLHSQDAVGTLVSVQSHGLDSRLCTATAAYGVYLAKLFWPAGLCAYFPEPVAPCQVLPVGRSVVALVAVSVAVLAATRRRPWLGVGGAWFLGMMVPVCGLVQVGAQFIADRYVYHSIVGLLVACVFGATEGVPVKVARIVGAGIAIVVAILAWRTSVEIGYWRSNEALFARAIQVTGSNCMAETQLGVALRDRGDVAGAIQRWEEALRQCPDWGEAHSHLGTALGNRGELDVAMPHFARAAESPDLAAAMHYNLGLAFWLKGRREDARRELQTALAVDPKHGPALALLRRIEAMP
jgi:hypothetical protein